jgi:hypothetical protein
VNPAAGNVAVSPASATLSAAQQQQFTATINGSPSSQIAWTISPTTGSISATGLYTAPAVISAAQTVTVRATSTADNTKFATATVTLNSGTTGTGLLGYWAFSEGSGTTAADSSGNGVNGTISGAVWTTGRSGSGLAFDGVNDNVNLGAVNVTGSALTISAWFKADAYPGTSPRIISKATASNSIEHFFMLATVNINGAERLRFRLQTNGSLRTLNASTGGSLPVGQWVHAAATYDGAMMRLYLNGTEVGSRKATGGIDGSTTAPVTIGESPDGAGAFDGVIDQVRIYNRALTASEIASLHSTGQ